ncbi:hypothetical protein STEG23_037892, partial [Scotinomys teguina]
YPKVPDFYESEFTHWDSHQRFQKLQDHDTNSTGLTDGLLEDSFCSEDKEEKAVWLQMILYSPLTPYLDWTETAPKPFLRHPCRKGCSHREGRTAPPLDFRDREQEGKACRSATGRGRLVSQRGSGSNSVCELKIPCLWSHLINVLMSAGPQAWN